MDFVDVRYINLISVRLQKFKNVKSNLYNFRCPICGDSQKNKNKARGYLYQVKNNTNYKCHNCGVNISFSNFLKQLDSVLFKQYCLEKFKQGNTGRNFVTEEPTFEFKKPIFRSKVNLPLCSEISIASKYLQNRRIDPTKFYFAEDFSKFVETFREVDHQNLYKEPRIIIPIYYEKSLVGFQGRSLGPSKVKYITVMLNDDSPKIYGLDNIRKDAQVFVTEGPFDSTFIRNSIAMCGADATVSDWGISNPVFVYDNEPRNKQIVDRISKTIDKGYQVVIWPSNIIEKDINDMVLSGHDVQDIVESNIYSGLKAKLQFNTWKKI